MDQISSPVNFSPKMPDGERKNNFVEHVNIKIRKNATIFIMAEFVIIYVLATGFFGTHQQLRKETVHKCLKLCPRVCFSDVSHH